ncbi:sulfhydryl oxidase 1-like [Drosophila gunungcola]|uniref:sulfhydryl oxidase 1-like n=1 Tax=Drosophila gunungcola TaxID=103775 RepID=UPI0022E72DEA|nr:sulfhydryl oxidase 1-like [Drosophila gunungcola]
MIRPCSTAILVTTFLHILFLTIQANHHRQSLTHRDNLRMSALGGHQRTTNTLSENELRVPALGKLVVFSSKSCHDCQSFASTFHKLFRQLHNWHRVLEIHKVDCEESSKVCQDYHIKHLPTLRFFHLNFQRERDGIGIEIRSRKSQDITNELATLLASNSHKGGSSHEPVFKSLQSKETLKSLFHKDKHMKYLVLVFQPRHSKIGLKTLLEMLPHPEVAVRIVEDPQLFANFGLEPFAQKLVLFDRKGVSHSMFPSQKTTKAYVDSLKKLLKTLGQRSRTVLRSSNRKNYKAPIHKRSPIGEDKADSNDSEEKEITLSQDNLRIIDYVLNNPSKIYQADIEMAIGTLLHVEIPKIKVIRGEALKALRRFFEVLIHLSPVSEKKRQLLRDLLTWLNKYDVLTGINFIDLVNCYETEYGMVFTAADFVGCRSTQALMRGFSCSLWHLFHFLTAEVTANSGVKLIATHVIQTISDFFRYFFPTCVSCSKYFEQIFKLQCISKMKNYDEEVLWLWRTHNAINKHLAYKRIEDPRFPKIQFPDSNNCPECRKNGNAWDKNAVLHYLRDIYSKPKLSLIGLNESTNSVHKSKRTHDTKNLCTAGSLRKNCHFCVFLLHGKDPSKLNSTIEP